MQIVGGKFKQRTLLMPKCALVRPTTSQVREAVFNICQNDISNAHFLDLFAGSGAMSLEALSRGAAFTTLVEHQRQAVTAIYNNIAHFQVEQMTEVICLDVFKALLKLAKHGRTFDIIYVDPPYGQGLSMHVLNFLEQSAFLKKDGCLFIEDTHFQLPPLKHLYLHSQRKMGRTSLYELRRVNVSNE